MRGTTHNAPAPPPYGTRAAAPTATAYKKSPRRRGNQLPAVIATILALIIFIMQLTWVEVSIDVGPLSNHLMSNIISHEELREALQTAGVADETGIALAIEVISDMLASELFDFINSIRFLYQNISIIDIIATGSLPPLSDLIYIGHPPDFESMLAVFSDLIVWEVMRVTGGVGNITQYVSFSDIPNAIAFVDLMTDVIIREGTAWGMSQEAVDNLIAETEVLRTVEQAVSAVRVVFTIATILLVIFVYLLVAKARPARLFGLLSAFIVTILAGAFALLLHYGNRMLAETIGDYLVIGATWHVYATVGLSVLAFALTLMYKVTPSDTDSTRTLQPQRG